MEGREIKFRGLNSVDHWVYGGYFYEKELEEHRIIVDSVEFSELCESITVNPESVGQYTGLKDKNGKEIYGEDVIKLEAYVQTVGTPYDPEGEEYHYTYIGVVAYVPSLGYHLKIISQYDEIKGCFTVQAKVKSIVQSRCEKLGNIHENPELLKKQ